MSVAAALLLLAQAAPLALPDDPPEIVVMAERLRSLSVSVGRDPQGNWHCGMDGTSGVERMDRLLCKAVTDCVREGAQADAEVKACVGNEKTRLLRHVRRELRENSR